MAFEKFPPTNASEAVAVFKQDVIIVHDVAHGDENAEVLTENGLIPSIAKFIKDTDERIGSGVAGLDHQVLGNRTQENCHSIGAITGLQDELDDKASLTYVDDGLALKANITDVDTELALKVDLADLAAVATSGTATDVAYDNSLSGLTAIQLQAAIDELKALIDAGGSGPTVYTVYSTTAATQIANGFLPTGWTRNQAATGQLTITHNLGTLDYVVNATLSRESSTTTDGGYCSIRSKGLNSFLIMTKNDTGTLADLSFDMSVTLRT